MTEKVCFTTLETDEKLNFKADRVYCKTSWAWIMTYQKSEEDIPKIVRIVFIDEP